MARHPPAPRAADREDAVEGLVEPLPRELRAALRRAVLDHALCERRRHFTPALHAGVPGGAQEIVALDPADALDHTLRTDVLGALLARATRSAPDPLLWLTRPGSLELQDLDALWVAAARAAAGEAGIPLTLVVVDRHGWRDPRSGLGCTWQRLRRR